MPKVIVVGGSLSGLFTALSLRTIGWEVEVYERSKRVLESHGGGLVVEPDVPELLSRAGIDVRTLRTLTVPERVVLQADGMPGQAVGVPQCQTSWTALHQVLRLALPDELYFGGFTLTSVTTSAVAVHAQFDNGHTANWIWYRSADEGPDLAQAMTDRHGRRCRLRVPTGMVSADAEAEMRFRATQSHRCQRRVVFKPGRRHRCGPGQTR